MGATFQRLFLNYLTVVFVVTKSNTLAAIAVGDGLAVGTLIMAVDEHHRPTAAALDALAHFLSFPAIFSPDRPTT